MKKFISFLDKLSKHNERVWFNEHKSEYRACKARFDALVEQLIKSIHSFDGLIGPMSVADCTYRIYRDTSFSANISPYKTHMGSISI